MLVHASFYLPRPKSHFTKRGVRLSAPWWPVTKPDLDKLTRALLDALTDAGIWRDDSQAVELHAEKIYHDQAGHLLCQVEHLIESRT